MNKQNFIIYIVLAAALLLLTGCASRQAASLPPVSLTPTGQHQIGKFVWFDLLTNDVHAAQNFYGELFGWSFKVDKSSGYIVINSNKKPIGGIAPIENKNPDVPESLWLASLSVKDVNRAVSATRARYGKVLDPPTDIKGRGRMAVIRDPEGAELVLIRAAKGDPPDTEVKSGEWLWVDLFTRDTTAANEFYGVIAGYTSEIVETDGDHTYNLLKKNSRAYAGVVELKWDEVKPNWLPYIKVDDIETTMVHAKKLGGILILRTKNAAIIADPNGGAFGIQMTGGAES